MPELPEVETIVRHIRPKIRGKRILELWSNTPRLFRNHVGLDEVRRILKGKIIQGVSRKGKNIVIHLSGGHVLLIHLMMSGRLLLESRRPQDQYIRFWIRLSNSRFLCLHDTRKFGWIRLLRSGDHGRLNLGMDALTISPDGFRKIIQARLARIKALLLDQSLISGVGNIYSDEALWHAGIHPLRKADSLSESEIAKLLRAIRRVLNLAVKKQGSSMRSYRTPDGNQGGYYAIRKVYHRAGEHCSRDGAIIKRLVVGQRSAHFCPKHQH